MMRTLLRGEQDAMLCPIPQCAAHCLPLLVAAAGFGSCMGPAAGILSTQPPLHCTAARSCRTSWTRHTTGAWMSVSCSTRLRRCALLPLQLLEVCLCVLWFFLTQSQASCLLQRLRPCCAAGTERGQDRPRSHCHQPWQPMRPGVLSLCRLLTLHCSRAEQAQTTEAPLRGSTAAVCQQLS